MDQDQVLREFETLPPEAQKQVLDFIQFLHTRYQPKTGRRRAKRKVALAKEAFLGIWGARADMENSTAWVRRTRREDWEKHE